MKHKKGVVTLYIIWFAVAVVLVLIGAVIAPIGANLTTTFYDVGEDMILEANTTLQSIQNVGVRDQIQQSFNGAVASYQTNITVNTQIYQYSWLIVLVISALVMFIYARRLVEYGGFGFV